MLVAHLQGVREPGSTAAVVPRLLRGQQQGARRALCQAQQRTGRLIWGIAHQLDTIDPSARAAFPSISVLAAEEGAPGSAGSGGRRQ